MMVIRMIGMMMMFMRRKTMLSRVMSNMMMSMLRKVRWRLMMLRMMSSRGRKTMMLRMMSFRRRKTMMILRRRTDPKTRAPTLREPRQAKCTSTCHKSHCVQTMYRKHVWVQKSDPHFVQACAIDMHAHFFTGGTLCRHVRVKCPGPEAGLRLCASQSSRHSTCHKSSFFFTKFTGKTPGHKTRFHTLRHMSKNHAGNLQQKCHATKPGCRLCVNLRNRHACQHFTRCIYAEIYKSNAADSGEQL